MPLFDPNIDYVQFALAHRMLEHGPYSQHAEKWQLMIDEGITTHQRSFLVLPRAHGKTEQYCFWMMVLLANPDNYLMDGVIGAVDLDNAAVVIRTANRVKHLHPQLFANIDVQKKVVVNRVTGACVEIITSDAKSSFGKSVSFYWIMDLHGVKSVEFYAALAGGRKKRPDTIWWDESNALSYGTDNYEWVSRLIDAARNDPNVFFYRAPTWLAGWPSAKEHLEEQKKIMPPSLFNRYMLNQDTADTDALLQPEEIDACIVDEPPITPEQIKQKQWKGPIVTAIDYGYREDFTAVATVMAIPTAEGDKPHLRLLRLDCIAPEQNKDVQVDEAVVLAKRHHEAYGSFKIITDPYQMMGAVQRNPGIMEEYPLTQGTNIRMGNLLRELFINKEITIYKDAGLSNG